MILLSSIGLVLNGMPLDSLIQKLRNANPELIAAKSRYEALHQKTTLFYDIPDPWVAAQFSSDMIMYSVSQELPFPSKPAYLRRYNITETQRTHESYREVEQKLIVELKRSIINYRLIEKNILSMKEITAYLAQVRSIAKRQYPLKKMPLADVLRIQVELSHKDIELENLVNERSQAARVFNSLFNQPMDTVISDIPEIRLWTKIPEAADLIQAARDSNPELRAMSAARKNAEIMGSLAAQEYLPDLMFKYEHGRDDQGMTANRYMIGITLPLWFWSKQNRMVKFSAYERKTADADYTAAENTLILMVTDLTYKLQRLQRTMLLYETTVLPQSQAALDASIAAFASSQTGLLEVLESEKMYVENMFEYNQISADFSTAQAELEQVISTALPQ
ncbi:MAG TPA: TolC family protein [bacterium]